MPSSSVPSISWGSGLALDKIVHILIYAIYTILLGRYLKEVKLIKWNDYAVAVVFSILFGSLMEVMQYYLSPSRFFDILDIIANIIGSLLGLIILKIKF
ncbi:VanZ family protein [Portibacter marinus]|uniref:VanZ family protein n=1 Tax=Portibacter marinus TaxID=2898660 RepID=UPI00387388D7